MSHADNIQWRAYYTDSRIFSSNAVDWVDLPDKGIIGVIVFFNPPYRELVKGGDWYYLDDTGKPTCTETHEEWGKWVDKPNVSDEEIKRSGSVSDDRWEEIEIEMMGDKQWP